MLIFDDKDKSTPTVWGRMNRANRLYFGISLRDMAKAVKLTSAKLCAYEFGREDLPKDLEHTVRVFWLEVFNDGWV